MFENFDYIYLVEIGVNECASSILSGCEHGCVNTLTSFRCTCRTGYKLAPNQKNCWGKNFILHILIERTESVHACI